MFLDWLNKNRCGEYLWPTLRACGGTRQDGIIEGVGPILMNIPFFLDFLA